MNGTLGLVPKVGTEDGVKGGFMSVCVPVWRAKEDFFGARGEGWGFQPVPYVYREACSRFKGVACDFHTGTTSTLGREVNWKSMGASVDRSDLGRWAMVCRGLAVRQAGKHASKRRGFLVCV